MKRTIADGLVTWGLTIKKHITGKLDKTHHQAAQDARPPRGPNRSRKGAWQKINDLKPPMHRNAELWAHGVTHKNNECERGHVKQETQDYVTENSSKGSRGRRRSGWQHANQTGKISNTDYRQWSSCWSRCKCHLTEKVTCHNTHIWLLQWRLWRV